MMNYLDFIILAILLVFAIRGYFQGIIVGLATIAALLLGIYIAVHFSNYLDSTLQEHLHTSRKWLPFLSFVLTFLLVVLGVMLVAKVTEKFVDLVGMGFFNHLGGALLGLVKGTILVSVLIFILYTVDPKGNLLPGKDRKGSYIYSYLSELLPRMIKSTGMEFKFPEINF